MDSLKIDQDFVELELSQVKSKDYFTLIKKR